MFNLSSPLVTGRRLLVVSNALEQGEQLAQAAQRHIQVVRYEENQSLAELLMQLQAAVGDEPVASVGFAVHGRGAGQLAVVNEQILTAADVVSEAQQAFWLGVGQLLQADGRIDLLSCGTAAGEAGAALLASVSRLSGKEVAGSVDRTGPVAQGGNWQLEVGQVDSLQTYFDAERLGGLTMTLCALNFGPQQVISTAAAGASSVYATDVDGDSDIDVLSASISDSKVAWYENTGGTPLNFIAHTISTATNQAWSVYATDVNGDSKTDVLSASYFDFKIAWYENMGGIPPSFTQRVISTSALGARSVYATDVDGDGDTDVLSASAVDNKIAWYENMGGALPSFTERVISTAAAGTTSVYATDVNGDGDTDVLSASYNVDKISWYENTGGTPPSFTERVISTTANGAYSVYATDVDGDGDIDVLSASIADNEIAWYENTGGTPPSFTQRVISTAALGAHSVYATDVDGDGDTDVLSASLNDNKIAWYENLGCPSLTPSPTKTRSRTRTVTRTATRSRTRTATKSLTRTASNSATKSRTASRTVTKSRTASRTVTKSRTASRTVTKSRTASRTVTRTASRTATKSRTASRTATRTVTASITGSITLTKTLTASRSLTRSVSATISQTPSSSVTPTVTVTASRSVTPSFSATISVTPSSSVTPTATVTASSSVTPSVSATTSVTPSSSVTPTVTMTASSSVTPSVSATTSVTPSSSVTPTVTVTASSSVTPSVSATASVTPSSSVTPTVTVTASHSVTPSASVTLSRTPSSSVTLTATMTASSSLTPSFSITPSLTSSNSVTPSMTPTISISATKTVSPTVSASSTASISLTPSITHSAQISPTSSKSFIQPSTGTTGTTGRQSTTGHHGTSGTTDRQSTTDHRGTSGTTGKQGTTDLRGTSGTTGKQSTTDHHGTSGTTGRHITTGHSRITTGHKGSDVSAASKLFPLPDVVSTLMLIPVMAHALSNTASTLWAMGNYWWYGKGLVESKALTSPDIQIQVNDLKEALTQTITHEKEKFEQQADYNEWDLYELEDLLDDIEEAEKKGRMELETYEKFEVDYRRLSIDRIQSSSGKPLATATSSQTTNRYGFFSHAVIEPQCKLVPQLILSK